MVSERVIVRECVCVASCRFVVRFGGEIIIIIYYSFTCRLVASRLAVFILKRVLEYFIYISLKMCGSCLSGSCGKGERAKGRRYYVALLVGSPDGVGTAEPGGMRRASKQGACGDGWEGVQWSGRASLPGRGG